MTVVVGEDGAAEHGHSGPTFSHNFNLPSSNAEEHWTDKEWSIRQKQYQNRRPTCFAPLSNVRPPTLVFQAVPPTTLVTHISRSSAAEQDSGGY